MKKRVKKLTILGHSLPSSIWVGTITHNWGQNVYAGITYNDVTKQVLDFVLEYWEDDGPDEDINKHESDEKKIDAYFNSENQNETLYVEKVFLYGDFDEKDGHGIYV